MSMILVLFLIFLSLHSCNARVYKVDHSHHDKQLQHSINKENDREKDKHVLSEIDDQKKLKRVGNMNEDQKGKREINVVIRESLSDSKEINLKVPQKKGGDEDKDFFIDYTQPRTHPPSHN